ncbi:dual specificity protein phosphatase 23-like isoform X1 [Neodiprion virginianus]|uniref:dual specificity protein phosphatase 23-like isoform X1 n=1 Tax=Neodiprion virginianus TaxID=2961670 RepID=UPI001EE7218E|nr:dual specificity protein phosphatase 23-like isoform X1 [Neodiprion virginianus]
MSRDDVSHAPFNFSWVVPGKLACTGWPQTQENIQFLADKGITHLVTLSRERRPPFEAIPIGMNWTEIPIEEFEAPTLAEVDRFMDICRRAEVDGGLQVVCVHCYHGRGRTGLMAACYLVKFQDLAPERAITNLRMMRPGSIETYAQERFVIKYHDALRRE